MDQNGRKVKKRKGENIDGLYSNIQWLRMVVKELKFMKLFDLIIINKTILT